MQLGNPSVLEASSGEAVIAVTATAAPEAAAHKGVNGGREMDSNSGDEKGSNSEDIKGEKMNSGGNRWPRQETLALLKIRSDMDAVFRDSSLKGPLWEEVSRKLAELCYQRSAKKCKEKFENVYKYHKRTKESRSGKPEGKTYKFFDQLQALENQFTISHHPKRQPNSLPTNTVTALPPTRPSDTTTTVSYVTTVPSTNPTVISPLPPNNAMNPRSPPPQTSTVPLFSLPNMNNLLSTTTSTSSSTASDEDLEERYRKKRKWKDYFRRLTRQFLNKQEEMQKKFLEAIEKHERERVAQQEAWRIQEMARINREHEILVQERSTAAAKDAAVVAFLQKLSGVQQIPTAAASGNFLQQLPPPRQQPPVPSPSILQPQPPPQQQQQTQQLTRLPLTAAPPSNNFEVQKMNNGQNGHKATLMSSSRWPKAEIHCLIRLRTSLEPKYQENGPKAPLWGEISAGMGRLGYNRSAKRCKEKWENINKYYKKMKESNKQRREDSKTCPYFEELDALYKEKNKSQNPFGNSFHNAKANEMMEPLMVQPEQQWRPPSQYEQQQMEEEGVMKENAGQYQEKEGGEDEDEDEDEDDAEDEGSDSMEDDEEERAGSYEIVTNKLSSVDAVE